MRPKSSHNGWVSVLIAHLAALGLAVSTISPTAPKAGAGGDAVEKGGATLTVWGKVGGRKWSVCAERSAEARRALSSFSDAARKQSEHAWAGRARACPNSIEVLQVAARKEAVQHFPLPDAVGADTDFKELKESLAKSGERAATWLHDARAEAARQGKPAPYASGYWLARVELARGNLADAEKFLQEAGRESAMSQSDLLQLGALISLLRGDLVGAERRARLGLRNAPLNDRSSASYVYALVLDRLGDDEGAERLFVAGRSSGTPDAEMMDTMLPLHERLYFRGRLRMAQGGYDERGAIAFFKAYLAQPEVRDPERRLAQAHIDRLSRIPGRLGG
jgi:hypothetical protein